MRRCFFFMMIASITLIAIACDNPNAKRPNASPHDPLIPLYTVKYDVQGIGSLPAGKKSLSVLKGHMIDAADMPTPPKIFPRVKNLKVGIKKRHALPRGTIPTPLTET